jgi:agmatine deiminase
MVSLSNHGHRRVVLRQAQDDTPRTPSELGYRMPAEWEPHQGTILTWPHSPNRDGNHPHWPGLYETVPSIWANMVKELEQGEEVHIVIHDNETEEVAKAEMKKAKVRGDRVHLHRIPNEFAWARDHGPIVVKNAEGKKLFLDWGFNAWGGQWEYELDDQIPTKLAKDMGIQSMIIPMILEGGSIDVNGKGTLMTTEDCLLNPNRNPDLNKEQIEQMLKDHLGLKKILWLGKGIMGDDTSGHVDDLTRFVGPSTVLTIINEHKEDPDYEALDDNLRRLKTMTDQDGTPLTVLTMPQPQPVLIDRAPTKGEFSPGKGFRIPASYANFYIANDCVLLPVWDDPNDEKAVQILQKCFTNRRIIPIDSRVLTWGWGSFHCVTQQIPL